MFLLGGIGEETEVILHQVFPGADDFVFKPAEISSEARQKAEQASAQSFIIDKLYLWQILQDEKVIGWAVIDNVLGKVQPITYLVIFDATMTVTQVQVLRYREQYGGAVQNPVWLNQFKGFQADAGFRLGEDIDGITGATLSANALARGVKRMAVYLHHINPMN
jgi:Na+-translocating ferredoxin:NAD+ oxidoreductase RnfG subunit